MASKDLINLGYSPDSGTGDSARKGGEKINNLFSDIYAHFGDSVINQDPTQPYYGYKRPYFEYEYKTGELHPAGRFVKINFKTPSAELAYDSEWGHGHNSTGTLVDTDGDGIPDIYRDSEWYFLSRGERIDADLSEVDSERLVHFVLPIASPGDQIIIRDGLSTWKKNIFINIWTTPYEFDTVAQVQEWQTNTKYTEKLGYPDSDSLSIFSPTDGARYRSNWHKVAPATSIQTLFGKLAQPFAVSRTTNPYQKLSPTYYQNITRYQLEFLYTSYEEGWLVRLLVLDAADLSAVIQQLSNRLDGVDSDLERGLYVSTDSDIRHTVPIFRRTADGREVHGNLSLRGDDDSIMTTIDSEDTALVNDPRAALGGDTVQPLTTTVRFKLRDNVKVKDNLFVGNDLEVGHHLQVGETLTVDSDLAYFNNNVQIHEKLTVDSDVLISGELDVTQQARFNADVRIEGNLWVGGDSTAIETESLRVKDNLITLSKDADNAPVTDTGFIFQRYDRTNGVNGALTASDTVYNTAMFWNEANDQFVFGETVSSDSDLTLALEKTYATIARDNAFFNTDVEIGGHLQVGEMLTVDSDLAYFTNNVQIHETLIVDSDVTIQGQLTVAESSTFNSDVKFDQNLYVGGDAYLQGQTRIADNVIAINSNNDNAVVMDTGFVFQRWDRTSGVNAPLTASDTLYNTYMVWDETSDKFTFGETVSSDSDLTLVKDRVYAEIARAEFVLYDSENQPRVVFEKAKAADWPDGVRGTGTPDADFPNERTTVQPDMALYVRTNAMFGRDSDDVVVFNSRIMSNIVPFGDEKYSLGDSDNKWKDLYLAGNTIYLGSVKIKDVDGQVFFTDSDDNRINLDGSQFSADSATIDSDLIVGGSTTFLGNLFVNEHAYFDSDVRVFGNLTVGDHVELGGHTHILESLTVDSDVFLSADLRVDSDVYIKGDVEIREDLVVLGELNVDDKVTFGHQLVVDSDVFFGSDLRVDSDVHIQGELYVGEPTQIQDTLYVKGNARFDSDVNITGILDVDTIQSNNNAVIEVLDDITFREKVIMDSDVIIGADLRVDSDVIIKGTLSVGQEAVFSDDVLFLDNAEFDSDVIIRGSLTVNGNTTTVTSANLAIGDNFIVLNRNQTTPVNDTGIIFTRYDSDNVTSTDWNAILEFDETSDSFILGETDNSGIDFNPSVTDKWISIGNAPASTAPFVFDDSGNSDPGGAPAGYTGGARPTLTGDGTGVIDGGTF